MKCRHCGRTIIAAKPLTNGSQHRHADTLYRQCGPWYLSEWAEPAPTTKEPA